MTMHLAQGLSTVETRKTVACKKLTKTEYQKIVNDHRAYNRRMKQNHMHNCRMSFDEYIDYVFGRPQKQTTASKKEYQPSRKYQRETPDIPSLDSGKLAVAAPKTKIYTGNLVKGICTMHKSNAVPVIDDQHIKDISSMRR